MRTLLSSLFKRTAVAATGASLLLTPFGALAWGSSGGWYRPPSHGPVCQEGQTVTMTVFIDHIENRRGGNVQPQTFLADGSVLASGQPFAVFVNGQPVNDPPGNPNVPGLFVRRSNGTVTLLEWGGFPETDFVHEVVGGRVVVSGGTIQTFVNAPPPSGLEHQGDGRWGNIAPRPAGGWGGHNDEFTLLSDHEAFFRYGVGNNHDGNVMIIRPKPCVSSPVFPTPPPVCCVIKPFWRPWTGGWN